MPHQFKETPVECRARRARNRANPTQREIVNGDRIRVLHPTKGWRDRSISRVAFGMVPNAPVRAVKQKFQRIKIEGTKNQYYEQRIPTNKYAGLRRTP